MQPLNELEIHTMALDTIYNGVPFAPRSKVPVNDSPCDMLRELKRAMNNVAVNAASLSKDYPYEFRTTMSHVHSVAGAELQDFELSREKTNG
jgi:hypothetical protein